MFACASAFCVCVCVRACAFVLMRGLLKSRPAKACSGSVTVVHGCPCVLGRTELALHRLVARTQWSMSRIWDEHDVTRGVLLLLGPFVKIGLANASTGVSIATSGWRATCTPWCGQLCVSLQQAGAYRRRIQRCNQLHDSSINKNHRPLWPSASRTRPFDLAHVRHLIFSGNFWNRLDLGGSPIGPRGTAFGCYYGAIPGWIRG